MGLVVSRTVLKVLAAKQDGSWWVLDAVEALEIPPDSADILRSEGRAKVEGPDDDF